MKLRSLKCFSRKRDYDNVKVDGPDGVCCWQNKRGEICWRQIDCKGQKMHYNSQEEYLEAMSKRQGRGDGGVELPNRAGGTATPGAPGGGERTLLLYDRNYPQVEAHNYQQPPVRFQ